jgi:hypothetical protein
MADRRRAAAESTRNHFRGRLGTRTGLASQPSGRGTAIRGRRLRPTESISGPGDVAHLDALSSGRGRNDGLWTAPNPRLVQRREALAHSARPRDVNAHRSDRLTKRVSVGASHRRGDVRAPYATRMRGIPPRGIRGDLCFVGLGWALVDSSLSAGVRNHGHGQIPGSRLALISPRYAMPRPRPTSAVLRQSRPRGDSLR